MSARMKWLAHSTAVRPQRALLRSQQVATSQRNCTPQTHSHLVATALTALSSQGLVLLAPQLNKLSGQGQILFCSRPTTR